MKKYLFASFLGFMISPLARASVNESLKMNCKVTHVDRRVMQGLNEGELEVYNPSVDHIQTKAWVRIEAGTSRRKIQIGENVYDREAGDRSALEYKRDTKGNWTLYVYSGDVEQGYLIKYTRKTQKATVAEFSADLDEGETPERNSTVYADLDCK